MREPVKKWDIMSVMLSTEGYTKTSNIKIPSKVF